MCLVSHRVTIIAQGSFHKLLQSPLPGKNTQLCLLPWGTISEQCTNSVVMILLCVWAVSLVCVWVAFIIYYFSQSSRQIGLLFWNFQQLSDLSCANCACMATKFITLIWEIWAFDPLSQDGESVLFILGHFTSRFVQYLIPFMIHLI